VTRYGTEVTVINVTELSPTELGLAPLVSAAPHMVTEIAVSLEHSRRTRMKASIGWVVKRSTDPDVELPWGMTLELEDLLAIPKGTSPEQWVRVALKQLARSAQNKMEAAALLSSPVTFVRIASFSLSLVTGHREQLMGPPAPVQTQAPSQTRGGKAHALPQELMTKRCCLNIQNRDIYCFAYCMVAWRNGYARGVNGSRPGSYITNMPACGRLPPAFVPKFAECGLTFNMLIFPVALDCLTGFEEENDVGLCVFAKGFNGEYLHETLS